MQKKKKYELLIPRYRGHSNGESEDAEALFEKFVTDGFRYDDISNAPDYLVYASAEFLLDLIPWIIDEMLQRDDTGNYIVYPIIECIDLEDSNIPAYQERTERLVALANKNFAEKSCQFLAAMRLNPPNSDEQVQRLLTFWKKKLDEMQNS